MSLQKKDKTVDLGLRLVCHQNSSAVVTLPKTFTDIFLEESRTVRMTMTMDGSLIITPVKDGTK